MKVAWIICMLVVVQCFLTIEARRRKGKPDDQPPNDQQKPAKQHQKPPSRPQKPPQQKPNMPSKGKGSGNSKIFKELGMKLLCFIINKLPAQYRLAGSIALPQCAKGRFKHLTVGLLHTTGKTLAQTLGDVFGLLAKTVKHGPVGTVKGLTKTVGDLGGNVGSVVGNVVGVLKPKSD